MSFLDEIQDTLGPKVQSMLASRLNLPADKAAQVLPKVAPLVLAGLKKQMEQNGGEDRVTHIVNKYGDDKAVTNQGALGKIFSKVMGQDKPDPGLGGLLGGTGHDLAKSSASASSRPPG